MVADAARASRKHHTVVRARPARHGPCPRTPLGGYDKWTQAGDDPAPSSTSSLDRADIGGPPDIGPMVASCLRRRCYPDKTSRTGRDGLAGARHPAVRNQIVRLARVVATSPSRPGRRAAGRRPASRIYLDAFWRRVPPATRRRSTKRPRRHTPRTTPGPARSHFRRSPASSRSVARKDEADKPQASGAGRGMPGARHRAPEGPSAPTWRSSVRNAAANVPGSRRAEPPSHWLLEEAPAATHRRSAGLPSQRTGLRRPRRFAVELLKNRLNDT